MLLRKRRFMVALSHRYEPYVSSLSVWARRSVPSSDSRTHASWDSEVSVVGQGSMSPLGVPDRLVPARQTRKDADLAQACCRISLAHSHPLITQDHSITFSHLFMLTRLE